MVSQASIANGVWEFNKLLLPTSNSRAAEGAAGAVMSRPSAVSLVGVDRESFPSVRVTANLALHTLAEVDEAPPVHRLYHVQRGVQSLIVRLQSVESSLAAALLASSSVAQDEESEGRQAATNDLQKKTYLTTGEALKLFRQQSEGQLNGDQQDPDDETGPEQAIARTTPQLASEANKAEVSRAPSRGSGISRRLRRSRQRGSIEGKRLSRSSEVLKDVHTVTSHGLKSEEIQSLPPKELPVNNEGSAKREAKQTVSLPRRRRRSSLTRLKGERPMQSWSTGSLPEGYGSALLNSAALCVNTDMVPSEINLAALIRYTIASIETDFLHAEALYSEIDSRDRELSRGLLDRIAASRSIDRNIAAVGDFVKECRLSKSREGRLRANLVKHLFRQLSLVPCEVAREAGLFRLTTDDQAGRVAKMKAAIQLLSEHRRELFVAILGHLKNVAKESRSNGASACGLGLAFSHVLFEQSEALQGDIHAQAEIGMLLKACIEDAGREIDWLSGSAASVSRPS